MSKSHWTNLQGISALAPTLQPLSKNSFSAALSTLLLASAQARSAQRPDPQTAFRESTCTSFPFPMRCLNTTNPPSLKPCVLGERGAATPDPGPSDLCRRSLRSLRQSPCRAADPGPHASRFSIPCPAPPARRAGCRSLPSRSVKPYASEIRPAPTGICQPAGAGTQRQGHGCGAARQPAHVCVCLSGAAGDAPGTAERSCPPLRQGAAGTRGVVRDPAQEMLASTAWRHAWRLNHWSAGSSM